MKPFSKPVITFALFLLGMAILPASRAFASFLAPKFALHPEAAASQLPMKAVTAAASIATTVLASAVLRRREASAIP